MVSEILFGMDESTLADVWFLRARFWLWGTISSVACFFLGHGVAVFGINLFSGGWHLLSSLWGGH